MVSSALHGLSRSLRVYYGDQKRQRAMRELYATFISEGDLAFDVGAHVGDRTGVFRSLGAHVVALEPQPLPGRALRLIYARDPDVTIVSAAAADHDGTVRMHVNTANPTVSTASGDFLAQAEGAAGWEGQTWDQVIEVRAVTLDHLIARYGHPAFIKIDVEGFEDRVLAGLSEPVPALSFEFTTIDRDVACRGLERLAALGPYRYDIALGETQQLTFGEGRELDARTMAAHVRALPHEVNSGDIYARLAN
ncbi:Methyltransferase fkbm family protein [Candidatus Filomicrobium marinum]|uniref:Methyltransferase fkbm family protein n=1 Tax=Candidatus Filomicrobium marinum TaxID=1608628 RepID=A0A0D6JFI1_9HYPH|nr:FkbM family methyltransferase [Candidatus Filomicrobium marinum]CFX26542.1 Methyltransferase fkbm family protein [Candidatus Filomicrobium marinum]CPR19458.1 Methyltransferase fkbm family protein [Candidatus Filomicrobium marinum]